MVYYYEWFLVERELSLSGDLFSNYIFYINREFFHNDMMLTFFLFSIIGVLPKIFVYTSGFIKEKDTALLMYYSYHFIVLEFTQIRAGAGLALCLLALYLKYKERPFLSLITFIVSVGFHLSTLVMLPFFIIRAERINSVVLIFFSGFLYFLAFLGFDFIHAVKGLLPEIVGGRANDYLVAGNEANVFNVISVLFYFIVVFMLYISHRYGDAFDAFQNASIKLCVFSFIFLCAFKGNIHLSYRLYDVFMIFFPVVLSLFVHIFKEKKPIIFSVYILSFVMISIQAYYLQAIKGYFSQ